MKIRMLGFRALTNKRGQEYSNSIWHIYMICMISLIVLRYILKLSVPPILFLGAAMLPILFGTDTQRIAFIVSCIPFSIAFQYKYALFILCVYWIWLSKGQLQMSQTLLLVLFFMIWEFLHVFYGYFSFVEYMRGFAELLTIGMVMTRSTKHIDVKLIIRALAVSVITIDCIMLLMQLQDNGFNILELLSRSANSYRFGQSNMNTGQFAINYNPNNLGFINNLSLCGLLILYSYGQMKWNDAVLAIMTAMFVLITLSRTAMICLVMIMGFSLIAWNKFSAKEIIRMITLVLIAGLVIGSVAYRMPSLLENIGDRFGRSDISGGRFDIVSKYLEHSFSSPVYFFFGIGMQGCAEKMNAIHGIKTVVPHNGMQEVMVAWGFIGVLLFFAFLCQILMLARYNSKMRIKRLQYMPFLLVMLHTTAGQFLTSGRALLALVLSYVVLSVGQEEYMTSINDRDDEKNDSE